MKKLFLGLIMVFAFMLAINNVNAETITKRMYCSNNIIYEENTLGTNLGTSGDGWTWDSETATLTLNGIELNVANDNGIEFGSSCGVGTDKVITIVLKENSTNNITVSKSAKAAIKGANTMKVIGQANSRLNLNSVAGYGMSSGNWEIKNATVLVNTLSGIIINALQLDTVNLTVTATKESSAVGYYKSDKKINDVWKNSNVIINTTGTDDTAIKGPSYGSILDISTNNNTLTLNSTNKYDKVLVKSETYKYDLYSVLATTYIHY